MAEEDPLRSLTDLPDELASLAVELRAAALEIPRASADHWFGNASVLGPVGETYDVKSVRADWSVSFRRRAAHTFFHFKIDEREWAPLDARVSARMTAAARSAAPGAVARKLRLPDIVWADPSEEDLRRFVPGEPDPEASLLLRVGEGVLGLRFEGDWRKARLRYSEGGVPGVDWPRQKLYPLLPLLEGMNALADWRGRGMPAGAGEMALAARGPKPGTRPVRDVVDALADAYVLSGRALAAQPAPTFSPVVWEVAEYVAEANLRLREDGGLAEEQEEEVFQLRLRAETKGRIAPEMHITASPGDLAAGGELVQSMIDDIRWARPKTEYVARGLGQSVAAVEYFLESARAQPRAVFLAKDGGAADVLLILQGDMLATPWTVLLRGLFRFHGRPDPDRAEFLYEEDFQVLSLATEEVLATAVTAEMAAWFLQPIVMLRRWRGLLV